ncbi:Rhodanese-related sulfurtransferase [Terriglobus roseus DSM 18391]|uniref:Rhodanese-related sulfurtransferase n=1 Tax=Terriglobus roseus (strain DSM 18391 / NRRL B-41598 / KBS 63) TaxID=926566 RepID=I3ZGY7_TERRK|nr:rhodanese-like domain-containing protein [Terriglobus roseus]AFL88505.1 Rhodanese-related sulfurtransferase [Terriglobus roseus DSM 18391]AFL88845.1 Rhodanese-related sulfurtransferase [Terriglobus roseus DSM 18391]
MTERWIDVREYAEFGAGHIAGSTLVPLGTLSLTCQAWDETDRITLICKSGRRAAQAKEALVSKGFASVAVLEGGMDGWIAAGSPVVRAERAPWAMERQVRVVAGSLVLLGMIMGFLVSPWLYLLSAVVGAGLVFAGVSNTCMMASLLAKFPWNRPSR